MRHQKIRTMDTEDATVPRSGFVDDTLAEEYQHIHPAPRLEPRETCG